MTTLLQQAVGLHQSGQFAAAEKLYRNILATDPNQPDALALLGALLTAGGDPASAIGLIEKAIRLDPKSALFKLHLGNALMAASHAAEAANAFREATVLQPSLAVAHYNLGNALRVKGNWTGAIAAYNEAVKHDPVFADAYNNLALALAHEKQYDEAVLYAQKSITIAPEYGDGWITLCNVAEQVKDYTLALEAGLRATQLLPDNHKGWFGYGVALNRLDRYEEAIDVYMHALALKPDRADLWDNLGQCYQSLNRLEEAEAAYRKTIEVAGQVIANEDTREVAEEEYGNRHWHLALIELLRGKYKEGFARYRARFEDVGELKRPDFSRPLWRGEDLTGKTLLVTDEQGYGDTLMLCRYLPLLKQRGVKIIFSVHPVLEPLFQGWAGADTVIVHGQPVPLYDYFATTFDLPHRFGTTLADIPAQIPYLPLLEPDDKTKITRGGRMKIGVVWGGNPLHGNDARRSIPYNIFAPVFIDRIAQFYSLNRDSRPGDIEKLKTLPVVNLAPRIQNFADAARLMRQLDLIITCDTATAHLAGGLGCKVWTLLPFAPDWRWLTDREDTPWYPGMRLFRQQRIGDWEGVIKRVVEALNAGVAAKSN
jgi:tetratricopeptide (TPR) repeat protein